MEYFPFLLVDQIEEMGINREAVILSCQTNVYYVHTFEPPSTPLNIFP